MNAGNEGEGQKILLAFLLGGVVVGLLWFVTQGDGGGGSKEGETTSRKQSEPTEPAGWKREEAPQAATGDVFDPLKARGPDPNVALAKGLEFVRRTIDVPSVSELSFVGTSASPDGKNAWKIEGTYRHSSTLQYPFSLRVDAELFEGQWYWNMKNLVISGKKFPDHKAVQIGGLDDKPKEPFKLKFKPPSPKKDEDEGDGDGEL